MGDLADRIRHAVREGRYLFSDHADNMLRERGIVHWQIAEGLEEARILSERPQTKPNPTMEVEQLLPDGVSVKAVWGYIRSLDFAKLVTVHFFDQ